MAISARLAQHLKTAVADLASAKELEDALNATGGAGKVGPLSASNDATHLGFFGVTAHVRASAITQTYATAARTHAAPTAAAVATTAATNSSPYGYAQAQADAIVAAVNALVADVANVKQVLNAVIDDLQFYGLEQ